MGNPKGWGAAPSAASQSRPLRGMRTRRGFDGANEVSVDGQPKGLGRSPERSESIPPRRGFDGANEVSVDGRGMRTRRGFDGANEVSVATAEMKVR